MDGGLMTRVRLHNPDDAGNDVVLLAGQSNMVGQGVGLDTTYLDRPHDRISQYAGISSAYGGQQIAALDPLFHRNSNAVGHAMTFAKLYQRTIPPNRGVLLVPAACSGTGFTTSSNPSPPGGYTYYSGTGAGCWDQTGADGGFNLAQDAVARCNAALALSPLNRLTAILWHQGEVDSSVLSQSAYATKLDALIDYFRANITGAASVPILIGQMLPEGIALSGGKQGVNAAHIDTPRRKVRTGFYYGQSGTQNGDNLHYNGAGQRLLGAAASGVLAAARANVLGTAPVAPGAVTFVQAGTAVTATWVRTAGRVTDYTVQYSTNGGSSWTAATRTSPNLDCTQTITGLALGGTLLVRVATVNEQGTSAWSTSGTFTLANTPGQVTGLAAGTATGSSVPLSWTAVTGATSYLIEYGLHSSGTWTTASTVTGVSGTVNGLATSTAYDFRVTAQNAAGSGSPSATVNKTTAASSPLLSDVGVSAFRAHGLRKLNPSYSGYAIRVRRSSDNTTLDIGFTAAGDLDTTALTTFAGAGSCFIATWYDQSGNGRDLTQATNASQPRIVNAGTVDTAPNGKPIAVFASQYLTGASAGIYAGGAGTSLAVGKCTSLGTEGMFGEGSSAGSSAKMTIYTNSSGAIRSEFYDDSASNFGLASGSTAFAASAIAQLSQTDTGTANSIYGNGAFIGTTTYSRSGHTVTLSTAIIGGIYNGGAANSTWTGQIAEVVQWGSVLNTAQRTAGEANQKAYYGTP